MRSECPLRNETPGWRERSGWRGKTGWRSPPVYRDFRPPITGEPKGVGTSSAGEGVLEHAPHGILLTTHS